MKIFVDTSVLVRFVSPDDPHHPAVTRDVAALLRAGHDLVYTPQAARETWSVLTRPADRGGYGLNPAQAEQLAGDVGRVFRLADDQPGAFAVWSRLVSGYSVSGKQVHDANHVATMIANGIEEVLTLDVRDFNRFREIRVRSVG